MTDIPLSPSRTRTYDNAGRLGIVSNASSTLSYSYDGANELTAEHQDVGSSVAYAPDIPGVTYSYDSDGNRSGMSVYDANDNVVYALTYGYTARNQVSSITAGGSSALATFTYDLNGNRLTKSLENGTAANYTYDDANRLTTLDHKKGSTSFAKYDYAYNSVNDRTSRGETLNGGTTGTDGYGYDAVDQVTGVSYASGRSVGYAYDAVGNRNTVTDSASSPLQPASYTTNSQNQYTAATSYTSLDYDGNGNLLTPVEGWPVVYDSESRPVTNMGGEDVLYDGRNRVLGRGVLMPPLSGDMKVYDGWNLVEEWYSDDASVESYSIYGPQVDELLCRIDVNTGLKTYYHQDALRSTVALTNTSGNVMERYKYDVYGAPVIYNSGGTVIAHSAWGNRFLFTGREWFGDVSVPDAASMPVYDYRNRIYSPTLGKFLQVDPIRFKSGDVDLYGYCENGPMSSLDPNGTNVWNDLCNCISNAFGKGNDKIIDALNKFQNTPYWSAATYAVPYSEATAVLQVFGGCNSLGLAIR